MKSAGHWWLILVLVVGLAVAGCDSEDGGVTDPLPDPTPPGDITVNPDEQSSMAPLNDAVQAAQPGYVIVVKPGQYKGVLVIDKPVHLISSAGKDNTILTNESDTTTVLVRITGSYGGTDSLVFEGLGINDGARGMHIESSSVPVALRKCDVLDNATVGVQVGDASGAPAGDPTLSLWQCFFRRNGSRDTMTLQESSALWITSAMEANAVYFTENFVDLSISAGASATVRRMGSADTDSISLYLIEGSSLTLDGVDADTPTVLRDGLGWCARVMDSALCINDYTLQRFSWGGIELQNSALVLERTQLVDAANFGVKALNSEVTLRSSEIMDTRSSGTALPVASRNGYGIVGLSDDGLRHVVQLEESMISGSFRSGIAAVGEGQEVDLSASELRENGADWQAAGLVNDPTQPIGGGLGLHERAIARVNGTQFAANFGVFGGGIAVVGDGASVTIEGGELRGNSASDYGAGIYVEGATGTISNARLLSNNCKGFGGGIAVIDGGRFEFDATPLQSNVASSGGGGVYVFRAQASFANGSDFITNASVKSSPAAADGRGGAVHLNQAEVSLDGAVFEGNTGDRGGALFATALDQDAVLRNCAFIANRSGVSAAAIYALDLTRELRLESCQIYDNELTVPDATVPSTIYSRQDLPGGRLILAACTITDNRNGAGAIWHQSGEMSIVESVVAFNRPAGLVGNDLQFVDMSCNDFWNNAELNYGPGADPGPGSFSEDPLFCDRANRVYTVDSSSPLLPGNNSCGVQIGARGQGCAAKM